ncbi:MAG: SGNH/GDSL hydrolase family protein [Deltaproteobacteria bacterium]|nr:SGNH/GDSL hydrolase family protein [Deltaproteobacteria bacterium]
MSTRLVRAIFRERSALRRRIFCNVKVYNQAPTSYFFEFAKQRYTGKYPSGIFRKVPIAKMLKTNSSENYRRNTEDLLRQALNRSVRVMVMTFPYTAEIHGYCDIEGIRQAVDEHNDILRNLAKSLNLPLLDLAHLFPTDPAYWGFDGIHANEAGTALEAELVTSFILEHEVLKNKESDPSNRE